jgi:predicted hotdog family 3-hydroxylacyl-ACP dehydratase
VLGARELVCDAGHFAAGSTLIITIERLGPGASVCKMSKSSVPCNRSVDGGI